MIKIYVKLKDMLGEWSEWTLHRPAMMIIMMMLVGFKREKKKVNSEVELILWIFIYPKNFISLSGYWLHRWTLTSFFFVLFCWSQYIFRLICEKRFPQKFQTTSVGSFHWRWFYNFPRLYHQFTHQKKLSSIDECKNKSKTFIGDPSLTFEFLSSLCHDT